MAKKILGQAELVSGIDTLIYTVPPSRETMCFITVVNTSADPVKLKLALTSDPTPLLSEYIEYDVGISSSGVLERTGIALDENKNIVASADADGLIVCAWGIEEGV